ncbi:MAG TPA: NAD(P)H-dependent oxidoreductase subunit E [Myxococcota bacterium]|mgnify:CR=1 FL=1|nr:NAD(P)H-dependent oxidoreductase subunit E [Myxococcota bacterium]HQK51031.1 NAD(P)H-dependent oxidoreductase subunit E [Myxococcota bacterium]
MALEFSAEREREFQEVVARYPDRQAALIPVLYLADREFGFLSPEAMEYVARRLDLPLTRVVNTASFYTMLRKRQTGRFHIQVCVNVACHLRGADGLLRHLERRLGISPGEITPDGLFSLEGVQCLAACGNAPALQVNYEYHEGMTEEAVDRLIDRLRAEAAPKGGEATRE